MQSQQILKMSSSSPNAGTQASAPLVDGIVNHILLQPGPDLNQSLSQLVHVLHFFLVDAILHHSRNLVIYWVEIWAGHKRTEMITFPGLQIRQNCFCCWGSALDSTLEAYSAPQSPELVLRWSLLGRNG